MNHSSTEPAETIEPLRYLSKVETAAIETELLRDYRFGQQQLIEIWGHACAIAITKARKVKVESRILQNMTARLTRKPAAPMCRRKHRSTDDRDRSQELGRRALTEKPNPDQAFPLTSLAKKQPTVLVVCGPDQNGSIGLVCARHLRIFEYEPTIYYPKRTPNTIHQDFTVQCEKMDIPFLSYLPTEVQLINDAYNLVIDAILGPETDHTDVKEPYAGILVTLKQVKIPIASVDMPSGWDVDQVTSDGINPDVLISLTAPKKCATSFSGKHFLAGRFLPYDIQKKYDLNLPEYPGTDCLIEL